VFYLFATIIVLGSLLTASFLTTLLDIYKRKESIKNEWVIKRCLGVKPALNMLIPGVLVDIIFRLLQWISRVVFRRERSEWIEKMRQVTWYIVYSPIILVIGIIDLFNALVFYWSVVSETLSTQSA
jgi:cellobiose-specific phosphotransferase system component IIC